MAEEEPTSGFQVHLLSQARVAAGTMGRDSASALWEEHLGPWLPFATQPQREPHEGGGVRELALTM